MLHSLRHLLGIIGDICFPPRCLFCGVDLPPGEKLLLCDDCQPNLNLLTGDCCPRCGKPHLASSGDHLCGPCLRGDTHFEAGRSVVAYEGPLRDCVHAFKYGRQTACLATFGLLFRQVVADSFLFEADLILPVPLHKARLRQRGFNQSTMLAREFFPERKRKISTSVLLRQRSTAPQTSLSGRERRTNLRGAFRVKNPDRVKGKRVVLVDDIYTTGSTLNECARTLKKAGAERVTALTLARVIDK